MSVADTLTALGYDPSPAPLEVMEFHTAVRSGNLVFVSGQVPALGDEEIKGKVGADLDADAGRRAAEICAVNCIRAVGAVADVESIARVVKVLGMVNVADGFDDTPGVVNGATSLFNAVFGAAGSHARSAVGMVLPYGFAVEVEAVFELKA